MRKIGILGGGQLGMLLAQSIIRLGAEAIVYDPDIHAPAARAVKNFVNGSWQDKKTLDSFLSSCDIATYEFENVPYDSLSALNHPTPIMPSLTVLRTTQNRAQEKKFLQDNNLPHVPYLTVDNLSHLKEQINSLSFPIIIKSITGGYDGKAQAYFATKEDLDHTISNIANKSLPSFPIIAEQAIDLYKEVSCITASSANDKKIVFPVFENVHKNHILDTTIMPADLPEDITIAVQNLAREAADKLSVIGILCTEFFISRKKGNIKSAFSIGEFDLYINEFAPRPHNSGHVTISHCSLSQFDALARILLEIPLSPPILATDGYSCMANLLGDIWLTQDTKNGDNLNCAGLSNFNQPFEIILYGKKEALPGRKMGHLVTQGKTALEAKDTALLLRQKLKENINSSAKPKCL